MVKKGALLLGGKQVGSIDAKGNFKVTDAHGEQHSGNVAALIKEDLRGKLISGGRSG